MQAKEPVSPLSSRNLARADRLIRGWIIASGANILGAASHGLAGGQFPHPLLLMLCTALSALLCVGLAGHRMPRMGMALSVLGSQGLLHFLFMNSGGQAHVTPSALHQHHISPTSVAGIEHHPMILTAQMAFSHLLAATLTYLVLRWGEQVSNRLLESFTAELFRWFPYYQLPALGRPIPAIWGTSPGFSPLHRTLEEVRSLRGPPSIFASTAS